LPKERNQLHAKFNHCEYFSNLASIAEAASGEFATVAGLIKVLGDIKEEQNGTFYDFTGNVVPS